jgi:hypothetical protein
VAELVNDINTAFGVRIGLVSMPVLYAITLQRVLLGIELPREVLSTLQGPLK